MPRLMSVAFTEQAVRDRTKTVTRRKGWLMLKPGDRLTLCRKVMGRKKGEPLVRVAEVVVVSVRREQLSALVSPPLLYGVNEVAREGFPRMAPADFIRRFFVEAQGIQPDAIVTRIEWRYIDPEEKMTEITTAADTVHWLAIEQGIDFEPRLKLVCTAAPGAKCRLRPPDDREEWHLDDPDLVDSGTCWAVQWAEDGGWETIQCEDTEVEQFGRIPVTVSNDDGPVLHPVAPHPLLLPIPDEPQRVQPSREDVADAILAKHYDEHALLVHSPARLHWLAIADAVLALFAQQPTVAEVKAEALREAAREVADVSQHEGFDHPRLRSWVDGALSRADRIEAHR